MSLLSEKLAPLWSAINRLQARQMSIFPATVTSVNPVRIRIDGEAQSLAASPFAGVPVSQGARVRVLRHGTSHTIIGAATRIIRNPLVSTASGVSLGSGSEGIIDGATVTLHLSVTGVNRDSGTQSTSIGQLHPALLSLSAFPVPGYYSNGAAMAAVTGSGDMSLRWAASSGSQQIYFATSYPKG